MNYLQITKEWGNKHHRRWMDPLRILFGFTLLIKGLYYIWYSDYVTLWLQSGLFFKEAGASFAFVLAFLHLFLGLLIMLGALTRFSSFVLIPVLIFSVVFANPSFANLLEILFTIVSLILSIFFFIEGSGKFSLYAYMTNPKTSPENTTTGENQ